MSYLVIWTPQAIQDVQRLYSFLFLKNIEAAQLVAKQISHFAQLLENYPELGKPAFDLEPEHRELLIPFATSGYILLYEIEQSNINILAIRHQKEVGY